MQGEQFNSNGIFTCGGGPPKDCVGGPVMLPTASCFSCCCNVTTSVVPFLTAADIPLLSVAPAPTAFTVCEEAADGGKPGAVGNAPTPA